MIRLQSTDNAEMHVEEDTKEYTASGENKLSVMHIVPAAQNVDMAPLRNITIVKTEKVDTIEIINVQPSTVVIRKPEICQQHKRSSTVVVGKPEIYQQRKRMLPEYKELFAALMKLRDKDVQKKLLDVINNHHSVEKKTIETQTDPIEIKESTNLKPNTVPTKELSEDTATTSNGNDSGNNTPNGKDSNAPGETVKKRKRKRKVSLPQANKESRVKQLVKINSPKLSTISVNSSDPLTQEQGMLQPKKRQRSESFSISECSSDIANICEDTLTNHTKAIEQCSLEMENGLLPIQDAIMKNQINKLGVYIFVMKMLKGMDLNDILTKDEYEEDLLQLAVINTCDPSIVNLLLKEGLATNTLDADSNSIIHLAILNDIPVKSLEHLMRHIELKRLLILNDDGYTPLHLAIRQDRYLLAECLINILDERLSKKIFYKRHLDELETDEKVLKNQFKTFYEKICIQMIKDDDDTCCIDNHDLKLRLLQMGDRRSGNTSLYFAIDNGYEHLIYFLLAHFTDPRTENLSGLDCKTYFSEYCKSLNLSLTIDNIMEKVIKTLS